MHVDEEEGKDCETFFRVLRGKGNYTLVEAHPLTGRQHQIRVHLNACGHGIMGDPLYGPSAEEMPYTRPPMALRSVELAYRDPFTKRPVRIQASADEWLKTYGWSEREEKPAPQPTAAPTAPPQKPAPAKRGDFPRRRV